MAVAQDIVGTLYDYFMMIDGAKTKSEHRDKYSYILNAAGLKDDLGARKLCADFILRLFKDFPDDAESSVQALGTLCLDGEASIRKAATETLVEICRVNSSYVKRVADLLIQMNGLAHPSEAKGIQQCLVNLIKVEPRQALEGVLDQIVTADDVIRQPAIKFLRTKLCELPPSANNSEIATLLIQEYKKILRDTTAEEFENIIGSLSSMKFFQTLNGGQMLVDMLESCVATGTPYTLMLPTQTERLITSCRLAMPTFSRFIQSTKLVEYFCDHVVPSISPEDSDGDVAVLQVFAELCGSVGDLKRYKENIGAVLAKLTELLPEPPSDVSIPLGRDKIPKLHLSAIECLLCALHHLSKRHLQFFTEPEQSTSLEVLRQKLKFLSSCMQLFLQTVHSGKVGVGDADAAKKGEAIRRVVANIKTLMLDLFHNPPTFKSAVHYSWKKDVAASSMSSESSVRTDGKISTKRKADDGNGTSGSNIRTKIPTVTNPIRGNAGRGGGRGIRGSAPVVAVDQAKLEARAKRFGNSVTSSASSAEGTARFVKTNKRI